MLKDRFPTWEDVLHADAKAIEAAISGNIPQVMDSTQYRPNTPTYLWLRRSDFSPQLKIIQKTETDN